MSENLGEVYVRVSRLDQNPQNQIAELRRYVTARGWEATEFIEHGVSGAKDKCPQLERMLAAVRRKRFDAVVAWKLDRLGRSMRHLVLLLDEMRALDVGLVTLAAVFHSCAHSFTKFAVEETSVERVVNLFALIPDRKVDTGLEAITGRSASGLRSEWLRSIGPNVR